MKFFKSVKGFAKGMAKGIRKGMDIGEKIVNTVDKHTGGALRSTVAGLTGGMSEMALKQYNANKKHIKKGLDVVEGKKNIKQALEDTKYGEQYNKGIDKLKKYEKIANHAGMIDKARSNELGRNVLNTYQKIKPALGV